MYWLAFVAAAGLAASCAPATPTTSASAAVASMPPTAGPDDGIASAALAAIRATESSVGKVLMPARIVRVTHLEIGESQPISRLDGSRMVDSIFETDEGPLAIVEAAGTFADIDPATGELLALGTHGFYTFGADGAAPGYAFIPCWVKDGMDPDHMEGECRP